ncbi:NAD(P)H-dependent oxidoreductase [Pseudomonas sp. JS3066]|uniref:FMN-dependent NADH-azoreductase n=1 Tax=unclassified Pseudomonas TaxID=196821 RepID=UPI00129D39CC|nr:MULTISPECIES: NAD(P)H-dependent oxidoreductase [unclassified Pseudomonas]MDH4655274.1 FMN-dependent NADH-azoreductase [Pseudomonas sp. BN606]MRK20212.1 FMN-dependent NADH-azoreductase [Pseudomonas sp. JG-B]WVK92548.1 NAD(P)H-dependent oxidoreductase [Pseudomonas sp. JS3066]
MPRVLLLECSPNDQASPGGQLAREMARRIHPKAEVIVRNLVREPLPPLCAGYAEAVVGKSDCADEHFAISEQLIGELERSHYLLISTPMHNYMVPAALKLWLDYVVRIRRTFEIHNGQREGLLEDRPTFVVLSSGGHYLGAKAKQMDFLSPYLRHVLGIIGLHHVEYIHLQGLADGDEAVAAALQQARERLSFNPVFAPEPFPDVVL